MKTAGARSLRNFLSGKTNARYHPVHILAMVAYLEWEGACGKSLDVLSGEYEDASDEEKEKANENLDALECNGKGLTGRNNRAELYKLYTRTFADSATGEFDEEPTGYTIGGFGHGALFHMAQIVNYQLLYRTGGEPIKEIEGIRRIWLYKDLDARDQHAETSDLAAAKGDLQGVYDRHVDLIIGNTESPEKWLELKSYSSLGETSSIYLEVLNQGAGKKTNSIQSWKPRGEKEKASDSKGINLHRQFTLDRAAAHLGHARLQQDKDSKLYDVVSVGSSFVWNFQKFNFSWKNKQGIAQKSVSVDLGVPSDKRTVRGALSEPIIGADGEFKSVVDANIGRTVNANTHVKEFSASTLIQNLASIGFEEALSEAIKE